MFNILANTFFIAARNPQHHQTDGIRFKQRQMDSTSEELFQKDYMLNGPILNFLHFLNILKK